MAAPFGAQPDGTKLLNGKGRVYFDRLTTAGVKVGERFLGNCEECVFTVSENVLEKFSSVDGSNGLLARVPTQRKCEISIKLTEVTQKNASLALVGTEQTLAQTGATATGETISPAGGSKQGYWYKLAKRNVTAFTTLNDDGVPVTQGTNNVNWAYDAAVGMVYITPGGSIVDASVLTATYTYATESLAAISGLDANPKGFFRFIGDPGSGPIVESEVWSTVIQADAALALISDAFAEYTLKAAVLYDATMAALGYPYFRQIFR